MPPIMANGSSMSQASSSSSSASAGLGAAAAGFSSSLGAAAGAGAAFAGALPPPRVGNDSAAVTVFIASSFLAFEKVRPPEPHLAAAVVAASSTTSPPRVGKSVFAPLYSSAFLRGALAAVSRFAGASFASQSFLSLPAPLTMSMIIFSAVATADSTPLISTVPSSRPTRTDTPVVSRMFFSTEPPVPMMRGIASMATVISFAVMSAWSFSICAANFSSSFLVVSTPLAEPTIETVPVFGSALMMVLALSWKAFSFVALLIVRAFMVSSVTAMLSTLPSFSMTVSISFWAFSTWPSSPTMTRFKLLRRTSAPDFFEISCIFSSLKTRLCSLVIETLAGS
mmetsp:Transcript_13597/g.29445  ORF Transcript_13597/g.29445 Transcript_13597/m.29445 type:complete len:339 (-) Transcript_13597:2021-3037(-)